MSRRTWQLKMLALAAEELEGRGALFEGEPDDARTPTWGRLVSFALQFGGRAEPKPTREEFDALLGLPARQLLLPYDSQVQDIPATDKEPASQVEIRRYVDGSWSSHLMEHEHREGGQVLRHSHVGADLPHGYFQHPEDPPKAARPVRVFHDFNDPRRLAGTIVWDRQADGPLAPGTPVELYDGDGNTMQGVVTAKHRDAGEPSARGRQGALWFVDDDPDSWKPGEDPLPEHPACGRCGTRRDVHDTKALGHPWQWDRPKPPPPNHQAAARWLRRHGPSTASRVAMHMRWSRDDAVAALVKGVDDRAVWTGGHTTDPLYWAVSHAAPPCPGCARPLVIASDGTAIQYHDDICPERESQP